MKFAKFSLCLTLATVALPVSYVSAHGPIATKPTEQEQAKFNADRANILAMAGTFKVKFDFQEQTSWQVDYTPIAPKVSGGHEVVRVIEDTGKHIKLQHILVIEGEDKTLLVKHWRQDWTYAPESMLVYDRANYWKLETVPEKMRKAAGRRQYGRPMIARAMAVLANGQMRAVCRAGAVAGRRDRWPGAMPCANRSMIVTWA